MKLSIILLFLLMVVSCGGGYHRVQYSEMPEPPHVTLKEKELIVTTRNIDGKGLLIYKVDINIRDRDGIIELRGYQAVGKPKKTEFKVVLSETQINKISNYKVYWIDRKGKTKIAVSDQM